MEAQANVHPVKRALRRYGLDALSAMALGLFATLIVGTILQQIAKIPGLSILASFAATAMSAPVVGAGIGVAVAWGLKVPPLAIFTCAVTGALGFAEGGPLGCYLTAVLSAEVGRLISGRTKVDIVVVPLLSMVCGGLVAMLVGPGVTALMNGLMALINTATILRPIPMGIIVSVIVGLALTAPISSAALCMMIFTVAEGAEMGMGLRLAAGAATVGCCAQMVGFAVISFRDNGFGGLISIGLGTSMLQVPNILRHPWVLVPPTLASALIGPLATTVFPMYNYSTFAGMGTSGLVGQIGTWESMAGTQSAFLILLKIALLHFLLPGLLSYVFYLLLRHFGKIKDGDLTLQKL